MLIVMYLFIFRYNFTPTDEEKTSVLKMFSNDLTIPNNFIGLENYKTKTNPQTTEFCDKLCVDDPLALLLGQWTRSSLSHNDKETDITYTSFIDSTICSNNEDELVDNTSEKLPMSPFVLPEPKNDTTLIESEKTSLFNISSDLITNTSTEELQNEETNKIILQPDGNFN